MHSHLLCDSSAGDGQREGGGCAMVDCILSAKDRIGHKKEM